MARSEEQFRRVAILGTGLIGGSFGLAARRALEGARIVGWDHKHVLREAEACGAIHEGVPGLERALAGADLVYVALPIGVALALVPEIARHAEPHALVTDACSTKRALCRAAANYFVTSSARFLGGHPMAGKELTGVARSEAELFRGAKYILIGEAEARGDPRVARFVALVELLGARPVWLDAETHDWAVAIISHLPQLVSVALARVVGEETDETGLPASLAGRGLRDTLRLAGSSYEMWRDIGLTNAENIQRALDRLAQAIEHVRTRLESRELEEEFAVANELYKTLAEFE
ncbi:MAG TPA: prephenate dehydrogenase [Candidatus Acidoferrales bacterium]|nr:prephenate dehydrogenase [Candidatus Acidoferrales bacterium]